MVSKCLSMRDPILTTVKSFLASHLSPGRPILLGFSGGPDSLALLHLLMGCRRVSPFDLHVAHVDHGWRAESKKEAEQLKKHVESLGLPFYLHTLTGLAHKEDVAREARLEFFHALYHKLKCQALILGHQGDDQSETVLKRIFEGASLAALGGIRSIAMLEEMVVWRPLLALEKSDLIDWLKSQNLKPLEDKTNSDPRYLRARMRTEILPELGRQFGKEVNGNLRRLGETAQELGDYLERQIEKYDRLVQEDDGLVSVDFSALYPFEPLELKVFLKKFTEKNKIFLSHSSLQILYGLIEKGTSAKKVGSRGQWVEVRGRSIAIKKG
jgi:tRNA(Ile)-lysidine synthase